MSAMSASPPVKSMLMPMSLVAPAAPAPQPMPAGSIPREKQSGGLSGGSKPASVPPVPPHPTANGMESSPPQAQQQQHHSDQPPPTSAPLPAAVAASPPPAAPAPTVATPPPVVAPVAQPPPQVAPLHNNTIQQTAQDPQQSPSQPQEGSKGDAGGAVAEGTKTAPASGEESMLSKQSDTRSSGQKEESPDAGTGGTAEVESAALPPVVSSGSTSGGTPASGSSGGSTPPEATPIPAPTDPSPPAPTPTTVSTPKQSDIKVATIPQPRLPKRKQNKVVNENKKEKEPEIEVSKGADGRKSKRVRLPTQPYQSPIPEFNLIAKMSKRDKTPTKQLDEKLIVFYRNEFLAVRNAEGGFYVCQAMQNIYKSSARIRIRWLSQQDGDLYTPDFYDVTDFDCILTNLNLERVEKNKFRLPNEESQRTQSILKRAIDVEKGVADNTTPTEEHPDGLDVSLFRNEDQLKKRRKSKPKSPKRNSTKSSRLSGKKSTSGGDTGSESQETNSTETRKAKKRSSLLTGATTSASSRAAKKRKLTMKKSSAPSSFGNKKQAGSGATKPVGNSGGGGSSSTSKRGAAAEAKMLTKRKAGAGTGASVPASTAASPPADSNGAAKRPRRAQPPAQDTTNAKTRSVAVVGAGAAGVKSKLRASSRK